MFDIEWTGRSFGNATDRQRAIDHAQAYCDEMGLNPAKLWHDWTECGDDDARQRWVLIERRAIAWLCKDWQRTPENVSLLWVE